MRDRLDELGDAVVALVTFTRARNLRGYRSRLRLPVAVLADEDRSAYEAYGLHPTDDETLQLGGDLVVGRDGRLHYVHRSTGPGDWPPVDSLIAAVQSTAGE